MCCSNRSISWKSSRHSCRPRDSTSSGIDAHSDIFSFGVVLYELFAGRRPFGGATGLEVLQAIIHGTPESLTEEVPVRLRLVVEKALEKDPAERYQSMREMVVDLRRAARQKAPYGHNHFQTWAPDGRWIYFVSYFGTAEEMDLWRIAPTGGAPERLTQHRSDVAYPAPIDNHTVLYVARDQDGSGPWLWALDVERKLTRRVSFGLEKYTSVAASADGRRLVATVANPSASLWSVSILDRPAEEREAKPFTLPTVNAMAPRFGAGSLFYLSSRGAGDGLWRYQDGQALEIWKGPDGRLLEPAAVSPDGRRVTIVLRRSGKLRLHVLSADGAEIQPVAHELDVLGTACWSPDGKWIVTGGNDAAGPGLFKIPVEGGAPVRLVGGRALNPVWSPDGSLIVYAGPEVAGDMQLLAVSPDGTSAELPAIRVSGWGERVRFLPNGKALVYMERGPPARDFWLLDLATKKTRQLTRLHNSAAMRTFDVTPDGRSIVFDRLRENSDIVLIDLPK